MVGTPPSTVRSKPLLVHGPPPPLLSVNFSVKGYVPAGVEFEVVTVKVMVVLLPFGVNVGVVVVTPPPIVWLDENNQVTPVGVPLAHVSNISSAEVVPKAVLPSVTVMVYVTEVPVPAVAVPVWVP